VNPDYAGLFRALRPEASLLVGAFVMLSLDLSVFRSRSIGERFRLATLIGGMAVVAAMSHVWSFGAAGGVFGQVLMFDHLAVAVRFGVLALLLLTLGILPGARRPRHGVEYVALLLFATTGFLLMAATQQLLLAFLALELASLSLYVLAGFDKSRPESAEAALKYFLFGGMAAAFLLFGFSLIYGIAGSIELPRIAARLLVQSQTPLLSVALVMVLVAFGFKAAAAPFHLWAPDVYEGAPTPTAALIASASKLAGFALFYRLLWPGLSTIAVRLAGMPMAPAWAPAVAVIAGASLLIGNFAALAQSNVRRLLAYSAIAHAGTMLLGVLSGGQSGPAPLFYYAATYGLATLGAFGVLAVIETNERCQTISDLAGLHQRSPFLAGCLAIFILSLAGIPPLAGFFGKFIVFAAALQMGGLGSPAGWLTMLAIAFSAVALYYYLIVLKQALVAPPKPAASRLSVPPITGITLTLTATLIVVLGVLPSLLLDLL